MASTDGLAKRSYELAFETHNQGNRKKFFPISLAALILNPSLRIRKNVLLLMLRALLGPRFVDRLRRILPFRRGEENTAEEIRQRIGENPLNPKAHFEMGLYFLNQQEMIPSYACVKTALAIARLNGLPEENYLDVYGSLSNELGLNALDGNPRYQRMLNEGDPFGRMRFLAGQISHSRNSPLSVLDIGGGNGFLSVLFGEDNYILVEPEINGLSGLDLPFDDRSFDVVVCCHTLEHIRKEDRQKFITQFARVSRKFVFLLGPFAPSEGRPLPEKTIFEFTGAEWAREHIEFGLPVLSELCEYLRNQRFSYEVMPYADERVMYWQYLAMHFAERAGEDEAYHSMVEFFNTSFDYRPMKLSEPHDFLIKIVVREADPLCAV